MTQTIASTPDGFLKFKTLDPLEEYRATSLYEKEPETITWIRSFANFPGFSTKPIFWDIGANIGCFSLYAAKTFPQMSVYSFEPFFTNFNQLKANIVLNETENCIPLFCALSGQSHLATFKSFDLRAGASGGTIGTPHPAAPKTTHPDPVLAISGNDLVTFFSFSLPHFIKIDVDGIEEDIVFGMSEIFKSSTIQSILVEVNSKQDQQSIVKYLSDFDLILDDHFNLLSAHSRNRRSKDSNNNSVNLIFSKSDLIASREEKNENQKY